MKSAVIVFPASNCDRDAETALKATIGTTPQRVWYAETDLPPVDLIVIPGGFSYGDYLRAGALAANAPIIDAVRARAEDGALVIGICNGFQILTECGLLPGALLRNQSLDFVCGQRTLRLDGATTSPFRRGFGARPYVRFPVAHHDGNYQADEEVLDRLEGEGQVLFRYVENVNGSARNIAGIANERGNVLGLMPHPERAIDQRLGGEDGALFFRGLLDASA
ncbi:phosphoribosylformylglycinamidine synthase large subunit [Parvularcula bermudensis HTCC2503]|uniref:Phosphoribosylformylglycinamidine synthase subunit PurQ n=1 Tax=Parvularcula bermudensis (strain ATCC BAA-594 / HTCC2503 / KCTC 12087) TaxID=314260 RepID=E0TCS9_PARBH|nr:phosphoribosylformylglycinamidine synthase subunit PurQ [Parvularcula bermudensis]ADM09868.1 phosphoribosylformylglycinamidine synthase large subunit [Parvularcula bermudensis HTCC2503]